MCSDLRTILYRLCLMLVLAFIVLISSDSWTMNVFCSLFPIFLSSVKFESVV